MKWPPIIFHRSGILGAGLPLFFCRASWDIVEKAHQTTRRQTDPGSKPSKSPNAKAGPLT